MTIIDRKLRGNVSRYIFQCGLATLTIIIILLLLNVFEHTAIIASLGATAFIAFAMPNAKSSSTRRLLGGYAVGLIAGCLLSCLATRSLTPGFVERPALPYIVICGGFAVGLSIFLMVITNTEHPPAAGIALGLVLNVWSHKTIIVIASAILIMAIARKLLKSRMVDLV